MVAANVTGLGQAWQANANTRINAAAAMPSAARSAASGRPVLTAADKIELMGVPRTQSAVEEESAADEIQLRLRQMSELAELAAGDGLEDADRAGLQEETEALKSDIDRIAYAAAPARAAAAEPSAQAEGTGSVADIEINSVAQDTAIKEPIAASWSGELDPSAMKAGDTITVNNITFTFVGTEEEAAKDVHNIFVGADQKAAADNFIKAIEDEAVQGEFKKGWEIQESNLPKKEGEAFGVTCSWSSDDKTNKWTLKFEQKGIELQEETKLHAGNGFLVKTGSTNKLVKDEDNVTSNTSVRLLNISKNVVNNGFILQVGNDTKIKVEMQSGQASKLVWDNAEMTSGTLVLEKEKPFKANLANGLNKVLQDKHYTDCIGSIGEDSASNIFWISVNGKPGIDKPNLPSLNIFEDGPNLSGVSAASAKENKAYLEFEVNLNDIKNGDSFNFRGMEFVFGTNDGSKQGDNFVYIPIDTKPQNTAKDFQEAFNECFAVEKPRTDEIVPSTGYISSGATKAGKNEPWYENLKKLLAAGVFEMRCFIRDDNTAVFSIYARNAEVLNSEGKIELSPDEGEGWKTAEAPADTSSEGGTEEAASSEGGTAPTSTEAMGISSVNIATRSGAAEAVSTLSAAENRLSAAKTEVLDGADTPGKLRDGDEAAQVVEEVKGQLEADGGDGVKAQSGKLEAGTAGKLTKE